MRNFLAKQKIASGFFCRIEAWLQGKLLINQGVKRFLNKNLSGDKNNDKSLSATSCPMFLCDHCCTTPHLVETSVPQ